MPPLPLRDQHLLDTMVALVAAFLLALPLGWERTIRGRAHLGWRTLPLGAVATCAYVLLSRYLYERGIFDADGLARSLRAVMTGIGFIGGGAILKGRGRSVSGIPTAASVWTIGAIGCCVGHGHYAVAVALTLMSMFILAVARRLAPIAVVLERAGGASKRSRTR